MALQRPSPHKQRRPTQFVKRDDFASETIDAPAYSYWKSVMRQFFKKKSTTVMLGILIAIILMSFIYPMFSKFDFNDVSKVNDFSVRYVHPNAQYWFGTDSNGKSLFDSVWFGARNSILIAVIATFINVVIGLVVGAVWGISKTFDMIMMEIMLTGMFAAEERVKNAVRPDSLKQRYTSGYGLRCRYRNARLYGRRAAKRKTDAALKAARDA